MLVSSSTNGVVGESVGSGSSDIEACEDGLERCTGVERLSRTSVLTNVSSCSSSLSSGCSPVFSLMD